MNTHTKHAHDALREALLGKQETALQELVADRCSIIGPKGFHISKQDWIHPHVDDVYELVALDIAESAIEDQVVSLQYTAIAPEVQA